MGKNQNKAQDLHSYKFMTWFVGPLLIAIIMLPISFGILYLIFFTNSAKGRSLQGDIVSIILLGILPVGIFIWMAIKFWTVVEISKIGVKKSFLKSLFIRKLKWEEITEIRCIEIPTGGAWLFFSKKV